MSDKNTLLIIVAIVATIIFSNIALAANGFNFVSGIEPHTRFNPLRNDCYYYYGYGSCNVTKINCNGVPIGRDRAIDLGDACLRNEPPKLQESQNDNIVLTENGKQVVYINRLTNIVVAEGQKVVINVTCIDEDPVTTTYSGWTTTKITQTGFDDSGTFDQTVTCTDSFKKSTSGSFKIKINDANRKPLFRLFDWNIISPKTNFSMTK